MNKVVTVPIFNEYILTQIKPYADTKGSKLIVEQQGGTGEATICLCDANNNKISSVTVDLPDEKEIIKADLDYEHKKIIFTYRDGGKFSCDISELVDGLLLAINTEKERAIAAEASLSADISAETVAREIADTNLQVDINKCVKFAEAQELTAEQQEQARKNINSDQILIINYGAGGTSTTADELYLKVYNAGIANLKIYCSYENNLYELTRLEVSTKNLYFNRIIESISNKFIANRITALYGMGGYSWSTVNQIELAKESDIIRSYEGVSDRPSINGVELIGNKTTADLQLEGADITIIKQVDVVDNVTSYANNKPLSANQGRALKSEIDNKFDALTTNKLDNYGKVVSDVQEREFKVSLENTDKTKSASVVLQKPAEIHPEDSAEIDINVVDVGGNGKIVLDAKNKSEGEGASHNGIIITKDDVQIVKEGTNDLSVAAVGAVNKKLDKEGLTEFGTNQDFVIGFADNEEQTTRAVALEVSNYDDEDPTVGISATKVQNNETKQNIFAITPNDAQITIMGSNPNSIVVKSITDDLQTQISNLKSIGRFLAVWDANQGVPTSDPPTNPYSYKVGDYYRIGVSGIRVPRRIATYTKGETNWEEGSLVEAGDVLYVASIEGSVTTWDHQVAGKGGTLQDVVVDGTSIVVDGIARFSLAAKQDKIDSSHKLSSDLIDDTDKTNKFVTETEKAAWNNKSTVSVAASGSSTDEIKYITINGTEKKIAGGAVDSVNGQTGAVVLNAATNLYIDETAETKTTIKAYIDNIVGTVASQLDTIIHGGE